MSKVGCLSIDSLMNELNSSVEFPQLTRENSNNEESSSPDTTTTSGAALLQQIKDLVNATNKIDEENKDTNFTPSPFQRTVNWTFENMKMLIGSDLPIFGDEQHPAVSLRLRYQLSPRISFQSVYSQGHE